MPITLAPALDQAREAAGDRDVRIAGGFRSRTARAREDVNAGLIDEFSLAQDRCAASSSRAHALANDGCIYN
ncbi:MULTISPECIES: hypothetical protein [Anaeromyxobacter]|uniref:hypothetical protein n=1 Tax=Anaeromyxobacter TaxID=161492 RepID=UPI001F562233|nr:MULTISPECIES: hypothetical protein [unclassified Anaeromyxobacter]